MNSTRLDPNRIICPIIAAMWNNGDLKTDSVGNVELAWLYTGLHKGLGARQEFADFQAFGIIHYDNSQKGKEQHRNPDCRPPRGACYKKRREDRVGENGAPPAKSKDDERWMNIFTMNGKQTIEHGVSTGVRGGDTNMPPEAEDCKGVYPCRERFDNWFGTDPKKKFYLKDILDVVCEARKYGDRGGEFAYAPARSLIKLLPFKDVPGREWQMKGAMTSMLFAFGRPYNWRETGAEPYMTMGDMKALYLDGVYPKGWSPKEFGCLIRGCKWSSLTKVRLDVPCDVKYDEPFWGNSKCQIASDRTCRIRGCPSDQVCYSKQCVCKRGSNLRTQCFKDGKCQDQDDDGYSFFGEARNGVKADNPAPSGNP